MSYNKDDIKQELTQEDIITLLESMNAEPKVNGNHIEALTVCHGGHSHKLYYYPSTCLFKCYTDCGDSFDVFDLVSRVKKVDFSTAIFFIVNFFNLQHKLDDVEEASVDDSWDMVQKWNEILNVKAEPSKTKIDLPIIDSTILDNYPQPRILDWEDEYITKEVCDYMNIRYDPEKGSILIPHYNESGQMIGIRERTLVEENEKWGKYRPAKIGGKMYNHPLGFNLYGLDKAKKRIGEMETAIVVEAEKSVFQVMNYLGIRNNITVSMCGSTLSNFQFHQLLEMGAKEICIGIDRDFMSVYDEDYEKILKKIEKMYSKYSGLCKISFMLDTKGLTGYKDSPTDKGKEIFLQLWKDRIIP